MNSKKRNTTGLIGTIAFHAILLTILLLFSFTKPEPVYPAPYGIEVQFGEEVIGEVDAGSEIETPENTENIEPTTPQDASPSVDDALTNENADGANLNTSEKPKVENTQPTPQEIADAKKAQELRELQKLLNSGKIDGKPGNSTTGSQTGIPGAPNGDTGPTTGKGSIGDPFGNEAATHWEKPLGTENCNKSIKLTVRIDPLGNVTKITKVETALSEQSCINAAKMAANKVKFPSNPNITSSRYAEIVYDYTYSSK